MRETAASLALAARHADGGAARALGRGSSETIAADQRPAGRAEPRPRRSTSSRPRACRSAAALDRARWRSRPRSRSCCSRCRSCSLDGQLDRSQPTGPTASAAAFDRAAQGRRRPRRSALQSSTGATLARVVLLPDGTGYLRGDEPEAAARRQDVPAVGAHRFDGRTRSRSRPACSVRIRRRSAFHASGPVHGVRGDRRARGRRRRSRSSSRSRAAAL